jgi:hypothetical protein
MSLLPGGRRVLVVLHCYTAPGSVSSRDDLHRLAAFCRWMRRETNQGEIGLVIADEYFAIRDMEEVGDE